MMTNITIDLKVKKLLDNYYLEQERLKDEVTTIAEAIDKKIVRLNHDLARNNIPLYRQNKLVLTRFIETKQKDLSKSADNLSCEQTDINTLNEFFTSLSFHLMRYNPPLKEEADKNENIQKETILRQEQQRLAYDRNFLQKLGQIRKQAEQREKYGIQVYFVYAWPEEEYQDREQWVQAEFLPTLYAHLQTAGIQPVWDKEDNFAGNNLAAFMGSIIDKADYVLVLGTESLRAKLLQDTKSINFEEKLIKLKWLSDLKSGAISSGKTTLIPYVLTGTRETSFTDNFIISHFQDLTIRAWRTSSYEKILFSLISQLYGVKNVLKWLASDAANLQQKENTLLSQPSFFPVASKSETVFDHPDKNEQSMQVNELKEQRNTF